jgi:hypothetical protein
VYIYIYIYIYRERERERERERKCRKEGSLFNGPVQLELHAFEAKVQKGSSSGFFLMEKREIFSRDNHDAFYRNFN